MRKQVATVLCAGIALGCANEPLDEPLAVSKSELVPVLTNTIEGSVTFSNPAASLTALGRTGGSVGVYSIGEVPNPRVSAGSGVSGVTPVNAAPGAKVFEVMAQAGMNPSYYSYIVAANIGVSSPSTGLSGTYRIPPPPEGSPDREVQLTQA